MITCDISISKINKKLHSGGLPASFFSTVYFLVSMLIFQLCNPRKSKDQTLPLGSRESFTWTILKAIICLVLDLQGNFTKTQIYVVPLHSISPPLWVIPWSHAPHPNSSRCPEWPGCVRYVDGFEIRGPTTWDVSNL